MTCWRRLCCLAFVHRLFSCLAFISMVGFGSTRAANAVAKELVLEAGSAQVIKHMAIKQVAVGNSQLIQANSVSSSEVVLFAKQAGTTTVDVWTKQGQHHSYKITISPPGLEQKLSQIRTEISSLSGVSARLAGQHIVLEGQEISSADRERLGELFKRHPDIVDLTSPMPWDQMVLLDVKVLEVPTHRLGELGVRWSNAPGGGVRIGALWSLGTANMKFRDAGPIDASTKGFSAGINDVLMARLSAMTQQGQAVLLAQPQLLARSGSPASFQAGGEVPYAYVDKEGKRTTLFKKYGVMLNVTPHVDRHGSIRAKVEVEVSAIDPSITTEAGPAMRVRKASTEFNIKSGQTLVLGGFVSHEKVKSSSGLLGTVEERERQVELAVFVTPVLVTPDQPDLMARVTRAREIEDWELGNERRLNVQVNGQPDTSKHQWHPSHPWLSQWEDGSLQSPGNTHSFDPIFTKEER